LRGIINVGDGEDRRSHVEEGGEEVEWAMRK